MSKALDLEQAILNCWSITNDINMIVKYLEESGDLDKTKDLLKSLVSIYEMKFGNTFSLYEEFLSNPDDSQDSAETDEPVNPDVWLEEYDQKNPPDGDDGYFYR